MTPIINALGLASVLTAGFALRFRYWRSPKVLVAYFSFFFALEVVASTWLLPPDAFGVEIGVVCLVLTALITGVIYGLHRYEKATEQTDE